jgi:diguanylate cyclase (GGDEF)-like protein
MRQMCVVGVALPDRLYGVLVAGFHTVRSGRFTGRMSGVAQQAATVLRTRELLDERWRLAHIDALTGLANRRAFAAQLADTVAVGSGGMLFLDLDGFKQLNDAHGHAAGDELLSAVAARLTNSVRSSDTVARLGGDEFVVLVREPIDLARLQERAERVREALAEPFVLSCTTLTARASLGMTLFTAGEDSDRVLQRADAAMYEAKRESHRARGGFVTQRT